ncbi:head GIN domain-containing protein [Sphingomonas sp. LaA6.9]|uniref:head GIN domain-containing protein n=1 Tax=Sphingomonas sp. LaA6.9 TaxID=2919914 RepID=UPI001F500E2D|nr:head GIN domain-containing protein [Sphingomonas sp. LaA6.9]MCJ8158604.1 DUF2807 domain-containing protein [Sphingomonas sp. LaA6.9]
MARLRHWLAVAVMLGMTPAAHATERGFTVTDFDRIRIDGPYQIEITTGRSTTAKASGDRDAVERVSLQVQGRTLMIRPDRSIWGANGAASAGPVTIRLSMGELRTLMLYGSGSVRIDRARGPRLELMIQGSGRLEIGEVATDRLDIGMTGSGAAKLAGHVKLLNAVVRGSAALDGGALLANDLVLNTETASEVTLGARTSAKIQSTGAGNTSIIGRAACTVTATGAGGVSCGD